ncbi:hypothetical protein Nepgr_033032 [Nepenthes gracilis]|uniref:Uncharacterized protein n=1 Tax=Nepenthes gracilis TaxID=150966 RepID=A0AAD3TLA5_NEPGR|nr:hypothetical protein Nepgr_033032 [Nepenthes gracilis]
MIISDELLEVGSTLSDTAENRPYLHTADSWLFMFPEVSSEDNLEGSRSSNASKSNQEDIIHETVECGSDDHLGANPVNNNDESAPLVPTLSLGSSNSLSSTFSDSSSEDLIVVDPRNFNNSGCSGGTPQALETKTKLKDDGDIAFSESHRSKEASHASPGNTTESQASDITDESLLHDTSPVHGPKIQVMERDGEYDPHRIPSSAFARSDSLIPAEWSAASNGSLFSIHVGNTSFGREHPFMQSGEFRKSGELNKSGEMFLFSPSLPILPETSNKENGAERNNIEEKETAAAAHSGRKDMKKTYPVVQNEVKPPPAVVAVLNSSVSCHSNESEGSTCSFAFPILPPGAQHSATKAAASQQQQLLPEPHLEAQNPGVMSQAPASSSCCFSWAAMANVIDWLWREAPPYSGPHTTRGRNRRRRLHDDEKNDFKSSK